MIADITGVVETGATRDQTLPQNCRSTLRLVKGEDATIRLSVYNADGSPVELAVLDVLVLSVKKKPTDDVREAYAIGARVTIEGPHRADFTFAPAAFRESTPGRFTYDVWLTKDGKRHPIIPASAFILEDTVTAVP